MDFIDHRSTANFIFSLSATDEKLRIKSDGNVGIGVSNPSTKLEVDGVITTAGLTTTADINFGDNDKAIFGAGSDLQIYHDGSNSYIAEGGTGNLQIQGQNLSLEDSTGTRFFLGIQGGETRLYNQGNEKVAVTSTGIDVTGSVISDGLTVDGNPVINGTSPQLFLQTGASNYNWQIAAQENVSDAFEISSGSADANATNDTYTKRLVIQQSGDISFYEDTGTTAKFFWDASAESLGIGIAPSKKLSVFGTGAGNATVQIEGEGGADPYINFLANNTQHWSLGIDDSDADKFKLSEHSALGTNDYLVVDVSGNVGIGTSSPSSSLTTETDSGVLVTDASGLRQIEIVPPQTSNSFVGEMGTRSSHPLVFNTVNTERMRIDSSGNVGIGTSSPLQALHVNSGTGNSAAIFESTDSTSQIWIKDSASSSTYQTGIACSGDNLLFNNGGERMRIDSSGDMIMKGGRIKVRESDDGNDAVVITRDADEGYVNLYSSGSQTVEIRGNGNSYFNGGNVGIGTSPSKTLDVRTSGGSDSVIRVGSSGHIGINVNVGTIEFYSADSDDAGVKASIANYVTGNQGPGGNVDGNLVFSTTDSDGGGNDSPTERMRIDASGNVGVGVTPENSSGTWRNFEQGGMNLVGRSAGGVDGMVGTNYVFKTNNSEVYKYTAGTSRLFFDANEIKFQQAASGTAGTAISWSEAMRLDASGNLLVGKTTTSNATAGAELNASGQIVGTFASGTHILGRNTNDGSILEFQKDGTTVGSIGSYLGAYAYIGSTGGTDTHIGFVNGSVRPATATGAALDATLDLGNSSGRFKDLHLSGTAYTNALGVGTTSPDVKVDIVDTAADVQLRVYKFDGTNNTRLSFTADDSGAKIHYRDATNGGALRFNNNAGEMARFDASGNLLVGKTAVSLGTAGHEIKPAGEIRATADGTFALQLNRLTSDGEIVNFRKDGTSIGSIGTAVGNAYYAGTATGITFGSANLYPTNASGTKTNGALDIGSSSNRFKDLYLSGGVYLGGTGSANKLDDYETGTWTPDVRFGNASTGITYNNQAGRYVKIGKQVTVRWGFRFSSKGTATGSVTVNGLPFTIESLSYADHVGTAGGAGYTGATSGLHTVGENNATRLFIYDSSASASTNLTEANFNDTSYMFGVLVYFTSD